jgi:hypothetical protein
MTQSVVFQEEFHHREGRFAAIKSPGTAGHEEHEERKKDD